MPKKISEAALLKIKRDRAIRHDRYYIRPDGPYRPAPAPTKVKLKFLETDIPDDRDQP